MPTLGGSTAGAVYADRGAWATTTAYVIGDVVTNAAARYLCRTAHTSGTFATDLAASRWVTIDATTLAVAGQEPPGPGAASVGASSATARADHAHPTDILAVVSYSPPSNFTTASATFADMDATNLKVTFTAPSSGKVLVTLSANVQAGTTTVYSYNLRDGSGDVAGTTQPVLYNQNTAFFKVSAPIYVTGLTPGQSYTWKWGHALGFGSNTSTTQSGVPCVMIVQAVR